MNADLTLFVRESLSRGLPRAAIRERLVAAGWRAEEVDSALAAFAETDFPVPVPRRQPYLSARETFLYLVLFVTLYITAFNTGVLLFAVLDRWLPDAAHPDTASRWAIEAARNGTAGLVIAFPIFLFLTALIGRTMAREPEKRGSKVRKWLTYITLFVAALFIIGDLTFLVQRLLSGEVPARVLLKTLVVFAIAGTVFGHYLADLRHEELEGEAKAARPGLLSRAAVVVVLLVIVGGFFASGSPRHQRLRVLDGQRVSELRGIANELERYARDNGKLPARLADLLGPTTAQGISLRDPVTREPYAYRTLDSLSYELCATFDSADSLTSAPYGEVSEYWKHPAGRTCFTGHVPKRPEKEK